MGQPLKAEKMFALEDFFARETRDIFLMTFLGRLMTSTTSSAIIFKVSDLLFWAEEQRDVNASIPLTRAVKYRENLGHLRSILEDYP